MARLPYRKKPVLTSVLLIQWIQVLFDTVVFPYKLPSQWREKYHQKCVLPSFAERKRQATFPETNTEVLIRNFFQSHIFSVKCKGDMSRRQKTAFFRICKLSQLYKRAYSTMVQ